MPWSTAQNKFFRAAEHNLKIAKDSGISQKEAEKLAHEGVKDDDKLGAVKKKPRHERMYKEKEKS